VTPGLRRSVCLGAAAGALWALSGQALEYPAFGAVLLELLVAAWVFPAARFQLDSPLSPGNWALLLFHVHLVVAPLLGLWFGFSLGTFPHLPSPRFINAAMLLSALAHFCFAFGSQLGARRSAEGVPAPRFSGGFQAALAAAFLLLGAAGMWLAFGGPAGYLQYVTVPETQTLMSEAPPTVGKALATFLRPFLPFGLLLLWSGGIARRRHRGWYAIPTLLLLAAIVVTAASYNRASMVGPVLAALAAYSLTVRRLSARAVAFAGLGLLLAGVAFGSYRNDNLHGPDGPVRQKGSQLEELNEFFQIYGEGPQFLGYLLERTEREPRHLGSSAFASLMYPLPIAGKPFRERSGVILYNQLIYGTPGIVDQIIPASGELFLNFHLPGVAVFFALLGFAVQRAERRFRSATTAFSAAAAFFTGMWLAFPIAGSLAVISQILIYSFWPLYAYYGLRAVLAACLAPADPSPVLQGARP
jgi:oligosaccharide repeat unit polymerase